MILNMTEIEQRLSDLSESRQSLITRLRESADALRGTGRLPEMALDRSIEAYQGWVGRVRVDLEIDNDSGEFGSTPLRQQLASRLQQCRVALHALQRLEDVHRLQTPPGMESLLDPVRHLFEQTSVRINSSPWDQWELVDEIVNDRHSLRRIVHLVERLYDLTDEQWNTEMANVQGAFGLPLATAIARGRVTLDDL